tara:strand:+ start:565 stop:831 length:267 start_codon:yes stop_codon:yes gene_type:complete
LRIDEACLSKISYCERVATAEAEIGVARDAVELFFGVAESLGYDARIRRLLGSGKGAIVVLNLLVDVIRVHVAESVEMNDGRVLKYGE